MKKTQFFSLFMATTILGTSGAVLANAEEEKSPTDVTTTAKVEFTANDTGTTPPTNPGEPGGEIEVPEDGGESGGKGALRIDWASNFDFGSNEIKNNGNDLKLPVLRKGNKNLAHFVQVSDLRGADNPDWELSVQATSLKKQVEEGTRTDGAEITGAHIDFNPAPIFATGSGNKVEPAEKPEWQTTSINLNDGASQSLVSATGDGARGTWSMGMSTKVDGTAIDSDEDIQLVIPQSEVGKIRKGSYTAKLNWNLSSTLATEEAGFMAPTTK
ncbi:WxL domain-containing protein [Vagococcus intermedius]|uniref:WxL domain-containing protein n=1 Tax=Vagococcus intermedius TaxID=2991418 RepID=A0AAF0I7X1_9ENTE|nr:WxL domain-containing protein [Vagococcus intermedius]WEG73649.1 WxL domain-containing protein [Vagococcus intermedius]WEG75733.1 WxL domain-containing protein [Vagococcus intermedius]